MRSLYAAGSPDVSVDTEPCRPNFVRVGQHGPKQGVASSLPRTQHPDESHATVQPTLRSNQGGAVVSHENRHLQYQQYQPPSFALTRLAEQGQAERRLLAGAKMQRSGISRASDPAGRIPRGLARSKDVEWRRYPVPRYRAHRDTHAIAG